jgi:hypothetical protein
MSEGDLLYELRFLGQEKRPGAVVRVPGAGPKVSGTGTTVPGEGAVPLSAESRYLARELLDAPQKLLIVRPLANARERGRGNSLGDAVCTVGRSVQFGFWMTRKTGLYFGG